MPRLIISLNKAPNEWKQLPTPSCDSGTEFTKNGVGPWDSIILNPFLSFSHGAFALFSFVWAVKNNYAKMAWRFMNFNCYVCPGIPHFAEGERAWHSSLKFGLALRCLISYSPAFAVVLKISHSFKWANKGCRV